MDRSCDLIKDRWYPPANPIPIVPSRGNFSAESRHRPQKYQTDLDGFTTWTNWSVH